MILEEDGLNFAPLFDMIKQYKWLILAITSGMGLFVLIFLLVTMNIPPQISPLPNIYKSQGLILINEQASMSPFALYTQGKGILSSALPSTFSYGELAVKLLKSKSVLDEISRQFRIAERKRITKNVIGESRDELLKHLTAEYDEKTYTVAIGYDDYDPEFCRDVVNKFIELLDQKFLAIGRNKNFTQKSLLETKIGEVKVKMDALENKIQAYQIQYGFINLENLAMEQVSLMARLRSQLILKDIEIKTYSDFSKTNDPVVKRLIAERDNLYHLMNNLETGNSEYENIMPSQKELPEMAREYYRVKQDLSVQQKIYEILVEQYEQINLAMEGDEPIFQVLEPADLPDQKIGPPRIIIFFISIVIFFAFSVILSFIINMLRKILKDMKDNPKG